MPGKSSCVRASQKKMFYPESDALGSRGDAHIFSDTAMDTNMYRFASIPSIVEFLYFDELRPEQGTQVAGAVSLPDAILLTRDLSSS